EPVAEHVVQIYRREDELTTAVAAYLAEGLEAGEPALVLATQAHQLSFAGALGKRGWHTAGAEDRGFLVFAAAEEALTSSLRPHGVSPTAFESVVGSLVDAVAARRRATRVRVFGEMVDLLVEHGASGEAIRLEELWNDLARTRSFSLLCGYRLDVFDRHTQPSPLPDGCRVHSPVRAAP